MKRNTNLNKLVVAYCKWNPGTCLRLRKSQKYSDLCSRQQRQNSKHVSPIHKYGELVLEEAGLHCIHDKKRNYRSTGISLVDVTFCATFMWFKYFLVVITFYDEKQEKTTDVTWGLCLVQRSQGEFLCSCLSWRNYQLQKTDMKDIFFQENFSAKKLSPRNMNIQYIDSKFRLNVYISGWPTCKQTHSVQ